MTVINSNRAVRGPVTAVPVVAGKGVRLVADTQNNRWVVEADETVLWEGTPTTSMALSETPENFEYLRIYLTSESGIKLVCIAAATTTYLTYGILHYDSGAVNVMQEITAAYTSTNGTTFNLVKSARRWYNGSSVGGNVSVAASYITKIVGINRIASN